jgi:hypothetical protein
LRGTVEQIKGLENNRPRFGKPKPIPEIKMQLLEKGIQECDRYDPLHEEVMRARLYLNKIRDAQVI